MGSPRIKVCYVLSYRDPSYIRTRTLISAIQSLDNMILYEARNFRRGILRYPETLVKLLWTRLKHNPDVYILGFRGHEIFWPVRWITLNRPLIFDSFVSPSTSLIEERKLGHTGRLIGGVVRVLEKSMLHASDYLLTDTKRHAKLFIEDFGVNPRSLECIYVGADPNVSESVKTVPSKCSSKNKVLNILFYGTFLPLHGVEIILEAADRVKTLPIHFTIIGGSERKFRQLNNGISSAQTSNIKYIPWVEFERLRDSYIPAADICLGGPFGKTRQATRVISGKTFQFMALGKPTIVGIIDEEVGFIDKENCLLIPMDSPEALAEVLIWSLDNRERLPEIGSRGRDLYRKKFDIPVIAKKIQVVLENMR